ncbi:hypothetical protein C2869_21210 [Saccharobesus litoralis]|uniref:Uncharacterized protein n=1 Tax=Saccharobesus litoralis TaxID=2172099 RepID=A0A2S0VXB9_9ALTE|nr:hypothetical protein [Saccharobesus litoralis]AWB68760.1 hypothetical protein C2869_21210 [Saccharobesus litoralis]
MQISNNITPFTKNSTINAVAIVSLIAAVSFALIKSNSQLGSLFTTSSKTETTVEKRTLINTHANMCHLPICGGRLQDDSFNPNAKSPLIEPRTEDS